MIGDLNWIMDEWKFSLDYIDNYDVRDITKENFGLLNLCLDVVDECENCAGYIP